MPLTLAVARESADGESRAALSPETAKKFTALGTRLRMEQSAGTSDHFLDPDYTGVEFVPGLTTAYAGADLVLRVTPPTLAEIAALPEGSGADRPAQALRKPRTPGCPQCPPDHRLRPRTAAAHLARPEHGRPGQPGRLRRLASAA